MPDSTEKIEDPPVNEPTEEQLQQEKEAKAIGWVPESEYKGDPKKWIDAPTYLERGQHVMPILRENNKRLQSDIGRIQAENVRLAELVKAGQDSVKALEEFHSEETKRQVEKARKDILAQIKVARKEGDIDAEVDLNAELARMTAEETRAAEKPPAKPNGSGGHLPAPEPHPDFKAWAAENPWYGKDPIKTHLSLGIAQKMRDDGDTRLGRPFMDDVTAEVDRAERAMRGRPSSTKVEESRGGGGPRAGTGKRFADLPAEAQASCHRFTNRLVGPGRAYKTEADWEAAYTKKYLEGETT